MVSDRLIFSLRAGMPGKASPLQEAKPQVNFLEDEIKITAQATFLVFRFAALHFRDTQVGDS